MNPDPDEHAPPCQENLQWGTGIKEENREKSPSSGYSILSEQARKFFPGDSKCRMFCGGKDCKFCSANNSIWSPEDMIIEGLYSNWVTHNIIAMARMSNQNIEKYKMFEQLKRLGVKTIINLQEPGEHAYCGFGNDSSGFSYNPQALMEAGFFYYNFALKDYGTASMSMLLDMVKVMQFALSEGKIAVHCHAGLGRTGLLIACYLIYNNRVRAGKCIQYVRSRRKRAIQTKHQMDTCHDFEEYLRLFYIIFPHRVPEAPSFSFSQFLHRQQNLLHGYEARKLKHIPKIIYICCERLLELCQNSHALSSLRHKKSDPLTESLMSMDDNLSLQTELYDPHTLAPIKPSPSQSKNNTSSSKPNSSDRTDPSSVPKQNLQSSSSPRTSRKLLARRSLIDHEDDDKEYSITNGSDPNSSIVSESFNSTLDVEDVCISLTTLEYPKNVTKAVDDLEDKLNKTDEAWRHLASETRPLVVCAVMWDWLDQLNEPILRAQDVSTMIQYSHDLSKALNSVQKSTKQFLEYMMCVLSKLHPIQPSLQQQVLEMVICHLTQKRHGDTIFPPSSNLSHMTEEKVDRSFQLFDLFLQMIEHEKMRYQRS